MTMLPKTARPTGETQNNVSALQPFPVIEPYNVFYLQVSPEHLLYVEEVGNPAGQPVLFLHGGPGAGTSADYRRLFDPEVYRIVLFDQRGCGRSAPYASLQDNTTWDLVADIEKIRAYLGIDGWVVTGGSWGGSLALTYAQTHPDRVLGLIIRAAFLGRPEELRWLYQEGCNWFFPDMWLDFIGQVPTERRHENLKFYYEMLTQPDEALQIQAAKAWCQWGLSISRLLPSNKKVNENKSYFRKIHALSRIESHYYVNGLFFEDDNHLLNNMARICHIPLHIIHGRYDMVCPLKTAWDLYEAHGAAKFHLINNAGHTYLEPGILQAWLNAQHQLGELL